MKAGKKNFSGPKIGSLRGRFIWTLRKDVTCLLRNMNEFPNIAKEFLSAMSSR